MTSKIFLVELIKLISNYDLFKSNNLSLNLNAVQVNDELVSQLDLRNLDFSFLDIKDQYDVVAVKLILLIISNFHF